MFSVLKNIIACLIMLGIGYGAAMYYNNSFVSVVEKIVSNERKVNATELANSINDIQELAAVQYDYESTGHMQDSYWGSKKMLVIGYRGAVKLGYDLSLITENDIKIDGNQITVNLPEFKILSNELDSNYTKAIIEEHGFWNRISSEDTLELERKGKQEIEAKVLQNMNLKKTAEKNVQAAIGLLLKGINKDYNVIVTSK